MMLTLFFLWSCLLFKGMFIQRTEREKRNHTIPLLHLTCRLNKAVQFCKFSRLQNTKTFSRVDSRVKMWFSDVSVTNTVPIFRVVLVVQ